MKAHELIFDNLVDVDPRSGLIQMNNRRMTLMSVEALGLLRRDLVDTLSMDRAKGFLMRYGWACGCRGAENVTNAFEWDSFEEMILAGPVIHTLEGVVTVETDILELDEDSIYFTGYWRNSFEVEEHLAHYGKSHDSVCWILVGYASGYLSTILGKEVLVYEDKCKGKGDDYCYFVGETVDYENPKHLEDLRYYQAEHLISELDRSYNKISKLNEYTKEAEQIEKELTDLLLEERKLSDLIGFLADTLDKTLAIERNGEVFECSSFPPHFSPAKDTVTIDSFINEDHYVEYYELKSNKEVLGNLVVLNTEASSLKERMILERALNVLTIQIFHQLQITQSLWQRKEEFFNDLISDSLDNPSFNRGAHIFSINAYTPQRVLVLHIKQEEKRKQIMELINRRNQHLDIFLKSDYIVIIVSDSYEKEEEAYSKQTYYSIKEKHPEVDLIIGVGRKVDSLKNIKKSYKDASFISDFVQLAYPNEDRITYFEDLEPVIIFLKGSDQEELIEFCDNLLGDLITYDTENNSNLLVTLKTYLDNNGNLQKTADNLHLSVAGLRYRIERIEEFCNEDLKTGTGVFKYQLAIGVYFARQIINKHKTLSF